MKDKPVFTGSACALVTPFRHGKVDYHTLGELIDRQIENGTKAIVICGTTGESAALTEREKRKCIRFAVEYTDGRIPVIAGTGSNDTAAAVRMSRYADGIGADALLVVTPYYNRATDEGLCRHFTAVADAVRCPVILYNVPSRTACPIPISVYRELAKHENIAAVKDAGTNIGDTAALAAECGDKLDLYAGNDDRIVPVLSLGGKGVISAAANVMPYAVQRMCDRYFAGDTKESTALQLSLLPLIQALFSAVNPIPVKCAMSAMGLIADELRLPLCPLSDAERTRLTAVIRQFGLLPTGQSSSL